jgi:hypothetical protein
MIDTTHSGLFRSGLTLLLLAWFLMACAPVTEVPDRQSASPPPLQTAAIVDTTLDTSGAVKAGASQTYIVKPGDTLWEIADRFLNSPWRWRELWRQNPTIQNPDLIYPGDVLELYYEAGQPRLRIASRSGDPPILKLSPQVRVESISQPIPTIPGKAIESFLNKSRILLQSDWTATPYIVGGVEDSNNFGPGNRIYARGGDFDNPFYQVFRPGEEYRDPVSNRSLGFDVVYLGEARLEDGEGDPATLVLTHTEGGVQAGDRLFPVEQDEQAVFQYLPHPVDEDIAGQIIASLSGGFLVGRYQTVVLNLGEVDGVEPGHVMAVSKAARHAEDPLTGEELTLPEARSGLLMVYKVFDQASYGLILEASRTIRILDWVGTP